VSRYAFRRRGRRQDALFNSANFPSIATGATGVIQIFNLGAERMLGCSAVDDVLVFAEQEPTPR
jgi:PAS domain-containing protein